MALAAEGLQRLLNGLRALGIGAEYFAWPPPGDPHRTPYRGWTPLEEVDAAVFLGRDAQIVQGLDELRGMRAAGVKSLFVILGPSGSGKSSFLRAGLMPRLRRDDRTFLPMDIVRPERAVLTGDTGLAAAIQSLRTHLARVDRAGRVVRVDDDDRLGPRRDQRTDVLQVGLPAGGSSQR